MLKTLIAVVAGLVSAMALATEPAVTPAATEPAPSATQPVQEGTTPVNLPGGAVLTPQHYAAALGIGMDVDWARTEQGIREFDPLVVRDYKQRGLGHVRIRVSGEATEQRLIHLRKIVEACEQYGLIPIIAYQADEFKSNPNNANETKVVNWWDTVSQYFSTAHPLLGFDVIYEPAEKLNHDQSALNQVYEKTVRVIHRVDPQRMVFIAPRQRSAPEDLVNLKWPSQSNGHVMAEWHIFPWGPAKASNKYPWTTGTATEKALIRARINAAVHWQQKTGHYSWVGGWSAGETTKGQIQPSQIAFATFLACELQKAHIPYALNADTLFYDGEEGAWESTTAPLLQVMMSPDCSAQTPAPVKNTPRPGHGPH